MDVVNSLRQRLANIYEIGNVNSANRNLPMEGLRGFAVILVFFVHYNGLLGQWLNPNSFTSALSTFLGSIGHSGVDLFFVLSGYLIYGAVIKRNINYGAFIKRRIERIYPTFLSVLGIYLLLSVLFPEENKIPTGLARATIYILQNALLLPGLFNIQAIITVAWSLSYEFFYYLFIPLLVAVLGMRRWASFHRIIFFIIMALLYTGYCFVGVYAYVRLIMFITGILLYEAKCFYGLGKAMTTRADSYVLVALVITFPLIYALSNRPELFARWLDVAMFGINYREIVLFVSFFFFTLACFSSQGLLKNMFAWTPLRWLGNMSYSYYLIHGLTLKAVHLCTLWFFAVNKNPLVVFWIGLPISFFLTLLSSTLLFLLVERRFSLAPAVPETTVTTQTLRTSWLG